MKTKNKPFYLKLFSNEFLLSILPISLIGDYLIELLRKKVVMIEDETVKQILLAQLPNFHKIAMIPFDSDPNDSKQLEAIGKVIAYEMYLSGKDYFDDIVKDVLDVPKGAVIINEDHVKAQPIIYQKLKDAKMKLQFLDLFIK